MRDWRWGIDWVCWGAVDLKGEEVEECQLFSFISLHAEKRAGLKWRAVGESVGIIEGEREEERVTSFHQNSSSRLNPGHGAVTIQKKR